MSAPRIRTRGVDADDFTHVVAERDAGCQTPASFTQQAATAPPQTWWQWLTTPLHALPNNDPASPLAEWMPGEIAGDHPANAADASLQSVERTISARPHRPGTVPSSRQQRRRRGNDRAKRQSLDKDERSRETGAEPSLGLGEQTNNATDSSVPDVASTGDDLSTSTWGDLAFSVAKTTAKGTLMAATSVAGGAASLATGVVAGAAVGGIPGAVGGLATATVSCATSVAVGTAKLGVRGVAAVGSFAYEQATKNRVPTASVAKGECAEGHWGCGDLVISPPAATQPGQRVPPLLSSCMLANPPIPGNH